MVTGRNPYGDRYEAVYEAVYSYRNAVGGSCCEELRVKKASAWKQLP